MPLDLTQAAAKLGRAEEHAKFLRENITEQMKACRYSVDHVRNYDTTDLSVRIKTNGFTFPLLWWSLIFADFINNLRTTLDYLVRAIAVYESGKEPPPKEKKLAFIIADNWADFRAQCDRLGDLSPKSCAAIESVQPEHRPHPAIPAPLTILRNLSNADKHRTIQLAATTPALWDFTFTDPEDSSVVREYRSFHGEIQDGVEIAGVSSSKPEPNVTTYGGLGLCISIKHGALPTRTDPGADRSDVTAVADLLIAEVRDVVATVAKLVG